MKTLRNITIVLFALASLACSKEKMPDVAENDFAVRVKEADNNGHYGFALEIFKGDKFTAPLTLEIEMQSCTGNVIVASKEYTEAIPISGTTKIEYLPYSGGTHKVLAKVTGGGKTQTAEIRIDGVTALPKNEIILPFKAVGFNPGLGEDLFTVNENILKISKDWYGKTDKLDWVSQGNGFVYKTINKVTTGCRVTAAELVELQAIIVEVNGVRCDQTGVKEIESTYKDGINNKIKFIGIYPENASNYDPRINVSISKDGNYVIGKNTNGIVNLSEVIGKEFEFHGASGKLAAGTIFVFSIGGNSIIQEFAVWNWKKTQSY